MDDVRTVSPWGTSTKWGVIMGLVLVVMSYLMSMNIDYTDPQALQNRPFWEQFIQYIIIVGGIIMAHNEYKKEAGGFMSFGRGVGIGAILGLVSGVLLGIYVYIQFSILHPEFIDTTIEAAMSKQPDMDEEQAETMMKWVEWFASPGVMSAITLLGIVFFSVLLSLVVSIFTQKKPLTEF